MRTRKEVEQKLREMCEKKLAERKAEFLSRTHRNCVWNCMTRVKDVGRIGLCTNRDVFLANGSRLVVCNDESVVESCTCYTCRNTEESVCKEFNAIVASPARCGESYPKIAMMLWFLHGDETALNGGLLTRVVGWVVSRIKIT